jgi:hypothetical protein
MELANLIISTVAVILAGVSPFVAIWFFNKRQIRYQKIYDEQFEALRQIYEQISILDDNYQMLRLHQTIDYTTNEYYQKMGAALEKLVFLSSANRIYFDKELMEDVKSFAIYRTVNLDNHLKNITESDNEFVEKTNNLRQDIEKRFAKVLKKGGLK